MFTIKLIGKQIYKMMHRENGFQGKKIIIQCVIENEIYFYL